MRHSCYILKVLGAVALIMAASSCGKSDILYDESRGEISISPASSVQSKTILGPVSDAVYPNDETMGIIAYAKEPACILTAESSNMTIFLADGQYGMEMPTILIIGLIRVRWFLRVTVHIDEVAHL